MQKNLVVLSHASEDTGGWVLVRWRPPRPREAKRRHFLPQPEATRPDGGALTAELLAFLLELAHFQGPAYGVTVLPS